MVTVDCQPKCDMDDVVSDEIVKKIILGLMTPYLPEPIGREEFCSRMRICRTKFFEMKRKEVLIRGRHYMQHGRKIIFLWGPELLKQLQDDCVISDGQMNSPERVFVAQTDSSPSSKVNVSARRGCRTNAKTAIDKEYCTGD